MVTVLKVTKQSENYTEYVLMFAYLGHWYGHFHFLVEYPL